MVSPALREAARPVLKAQTILWAAMTAAVVVYILIVHVAARPDADPVPPVLRLGLSCLALAEIVAVFLYRRFQLSDDALRRLVDDEGTLSGITEIQNASEEMLRSVEALDAAERKVLNLLFAVQTRVVIALALSETVGIYGLVLAFMSGIPSDVYPFAGAALMLCLLNRPPGMELVEKAYAWVRVSR